MSWYCDIIIAIEDLGLGVEQCTYVVIRRSRIVAIEDSELRVEQCINVMTRKMRGTHPYLFILYNNGGIA